MSITTGLAKARDFIFPYQSGIRKKQKKKKNQTYVYKEWQMEWI